MSATDKSTPRPWKRDEYDDAVGYDCMTGGITIRSATGCIASLEAYDYGQSRSWDGTVWERERMEADAALIVRSVNRSDAVDALVKAARHATMEWRLHGQLTDSCRVLEAALAALDKEPDA